VTYDILIIGGGINGAGIARNPGTVDAAADDEKIIGFHAPLPSYRHGVRKAR